MPQEEGGRRDLNMLSTWWDGKDVSRGGEERYVD